MSIIDNIIINHTDMEVEKYSGGSLLSTVTHNNTRVTYKLHLFFGYDEKRNTVSRTIELTEQQFVKLGGELAKKNNSVLQDNKETLSDDELFGTSSLRVRNEPTLTNTLTTNTSNTNTLDLKKYHEYDKDIITELMSHRKMLKKPIKTNRMLSGLLANLERYATHWKISFEEACDFYLQQSWISIDPEYKYTGRHIKEPTQDLSFAEIRQKLQEAKVININKQIG